MVELSLVARYVTALVALIWGVMKFVDAHSFSKNGRRTHMAGTVFVVLGVVLILTGLITPVITIPVAAIACSLNMAVMLVLSGVQAKSDGRMVLDGEERFWPALEIVCWFATALILVFDVNHIGPMEPARSSLGPFPTVVIPFLTILLHVLLQRRMRGGQPRTMRTWHWDILNGLLWISILVLVGIPSE